MDIEEFRSMFETSPLNSGETPLGSARPSIRLLWVEILQFGIVLLLTVMGPLLIGIVAVLLGTIEANEILAGAALGAGAIGFEILFFLPRILRAWIHVAFTRYIFTTDRLYTQTRFLSTDLKIVPYEKITLVRLRRSVLDRLLGVTEIAAHAYGAPLDFVRVRGLREPLPLYSLTLERIRVHNTAEAIVRSD